MILNFERSFQGELMTIQILSDETINKIAAGEAIENPASVVKELVENAFDAGGKTLTIEIQHGGFSLIRVSDDGSGMTSEDLLLSFKRHATSKIRVAEDLNVVATMGFRGEALASIAAISKLKIITSKGGVGAEASLEIGVIPAARNQGTTVEALSLFYNVPARKKFQKSAAASTGEIRKFLTKFALAHTDIHLRFLVDGKEILHVLPGSLMKRAEGVLGKEFLSQAKEVSRRDDDCSLTGFLGSPMDARSNRLGQYLFVNGRCVACPQITQAVYEGYGTRLPSRLHPIFILHLTLPPDWIDVNVHPQKREIRLRKENEIQQRILKWIMEAFQQKKVPQEFSRGTWDFSPPLKFQEKKEVPPPVFQEMQEELQVLGVVGSYLIANGSSHFAIPGKEGPYDGLVMVDLKGAYARILYERHLSEEGAALQMLMIPLTVEFPPYEAGILLRHLEEIRKMGIDLRSFGDGVFIIDALSPDIEEKMVQGLLEEFAAALDEKIVEKQRQKKLAMTLSSYARSQKTGWTVVEGRQLVKELLKTSSPYDCPKGKPTVIHLSHDAIENLFQRPPR